MNSDTELYHYGILGMKWGIRRYQNPDGSLTEAGKRHQKKLEKKEIAADRKRAAKDVSLLDDEELESRIRRLEKEKRLRDLTKEVVTPGQKKAEDMLDRYGNQIISSAIGSTMGAVGAAYITSTINPQTSAFDRAREQAEIDKELARLGYYSKHYDPSGNLK